MKSDLAYRIGRLAYAAKIGGMLARQHSKKTGALVTLDHTYWNGNSYTWQFNINEYGYHHKQLVPSKEVLSMFNASYPTPITPVHFMLIKLDLNRSVGV